MSPRRSPGSAPALRAPRRPGAGHAGTGPTTEREPPPAHPRNRAVLVAGWQADRLRPQGLGARGPSSAAFIPAAGRGSAPAWSPDGRWIAFFGKSHRLNIIPAGGGRVRHVGKVSGSIVDWQPLPARPPAPCLTPSGSTVIASNDIATVSVDKLGGYVLPPNVTAAVMGCLRADGRERLLTSYTGTNPEQTNVPEAAVGGTYAALVTHSVGYNRYTSSAYAATGCGCSICELELAPPFPPANGSSAPTRPAHRARAAWTRSSSAATPSAPSTQP